jgi:hypothetical protein
VAKCNSLAIPLKCSVLADVDLGTAGPNATEASGHVKIGLMDVEKQYEGLSKRSVVGQFALQFSVETNELLGVHSKF